MPSWRDELASLSPAEIRRRNRAVYRLEVDQPGVKWRMFQEQYKKEQKGLQNRGRQEAKRREKPSRVVQGVWKRFHYVADRRVKQRGGRASSLLHMLFLHWDKRNSGKLTNDQLLGAAAQIGVPLARREAEEVTEYYARAAGGAEEEIPHMTLLNDVTSGAPGLLDIDSATTVRLLGSARSEGSLLGTSKPAQKRSAVVKAFRAKLQQMSSIFVRYIPSEEVFLHHEVLEMEGGLALCGGALQYQHLEPHNRRENCLLAQLQAFLKTDQHDAMVAKRIREVGGSQYTILRGIFLNWDVDQSGKTETGKLRGALRSLNMRISSSQATEIARYYAKTGDRDGEFSYMDLVHDLSGGDHGPFALETDEERQYGPAVSSSDSCCRYDGATSRRSDLAEDLHFTARPREKPRNRVVERFKLRLRDSLERRIKQKGGVHHAIIREAFLKWDADASGKLDPKELAGALNQMGVRATPEETRAIVGYYDLDGTGEMNYELLCKEIKTMSHPILSYIEEVDVLNGLSHTVCEPDLVKSALDRARSGVFAAGRRVTKNGDIADILSRMSPQDLLMGTCVRFDAYDRGLLDASTLREVWKALKIAMRRSETAALIAWLDRSNRKAIDPVDLCRSVFGDSYSSARQPFDGSANGVNSNVNGFDLLASSASLPLPQGRAPPDDLNGNRTLPPLPDKGHPADFRHPRRYVNEMAWNWQRPHGRRRSWHDRMGAERIVGTASPGGIGRDGTVRHGSTGYGRRGRGSDVLQVGGGGVVAEKARIVRRLKELKQEKAALLLRRHEADEEVRRRGGRCGDAI